MNEEVSEHHLKKSKYTRSLSACCLLRCNIRGTPNVTLFTGWVGAGFLVLLVGLAVVFGLLVHPEVSSEVPTC